ncbi:hypothetical protein CRUP_016989, partial [Coryphaenoides rupestris]
MLHFRRSALLKELFRTNLKPTPVHRRRVAGADASLDAGVASQLKVFGAGVHPSWAARSSRCYCTKPEGAVTPDEQAKAKDEDVKAAGATGATADKRRNAGILPSLEDLLFYTIAEGQEKIPAHKFISALKTTGLRTGDPRLKECMATLKETLKNTSDGAFRKKFVIPDFPAFAGHINELYESAKKLDEGQVADYIPQLAKFSPDLWAVSLCTVDGQRHTVGDTKVPFCLQSCVKPLKYAIAVHDHGTEYVHSFIGKEPSGLRFNKLFLDEDGASNAEKFDYCFPEGTDMTSILDFYFQLCSIEVTCESASVMAATLANGGFCPITGERVLSPESVRDTLSLMHSCGMYDFSGQFAFHVGLPAKSGVAGGILLVVPNVMGIMCWSPPLDKLGNSVRGIQFCTVKSVINLLFAAYTGDVSALRRFALSSIDMEQRDYDSRTALHVAAAEG